MVSLQLNQQGIRPQPSVQLISCKCCPTCAHLNPGDGMYCVLCGSDISHAHPSTEQDHAQLMGVTICPTCGEHYNARATICKHCDTPLLFRKNTPRSPRAFSSPSTICPNCRKTIRSNSHFCNFCGRLLELTFTYTVKPIIPITLCNKRLAYHDIAFPTVAKVNCGGLTDSGAGKNLFDISLANILAIDLTDAPTEPFAGIDPNGILIGYQACIEIGIANKFFETLVYFAAGMTWPHMGLLGQLGFFDRFKYHLDEWNKKIVLNEGDALIEQRYTICPACSQETIDQNGQPTNFCWFCGHSLKEPTTTNGHLKGAEDGPRRVPFRLYWP